MNFDMTFVHLNDIHGRITGEEESINFSKLFTFLEELKKDSKNGKVFLIDSGDTLHGTPYANLSKGESIVKLFNMLNFDYVTIGNHDFNYGYSHLKELINLQNYKTLALNLLDDKNSSPFIPFEIKNFNGINICFFGIVTPETYFKTNLKNIENLKIIDPEIAIQNLFLDLKNQKIDFFVGITHLGCDESTREIYKSLYLAHKFPQLNLILDGHSHTEIDKKWLINNTLISQTGSHNKKIALIRVKLNKPSNIYEYKLISKEVINRYPSNKKIEREIEEILKNQNTILNKIINYTDVDLIGERKFVRTQETNLSQLITDAVKWKTRCDAVLLNGGIIRSSISKGDITIGDIFKTLPFGNFIVSKKVPGLLLKEALENGLKAFPNSSGAMAQVSGIKVFFDSSKSPSNRISKILVNGIEIDYNRFYSIAITDFMALGGEEYSSFRKCENLSQFSTIEEIVCEYLEKNNLNFNFSKRLIEQPKEI